MKSIIVNPNEKVNYNAISENDTATYYINKVAVLLPDDNYKNTSYLIKKIWTVILKF